MQPAFLITSAINTKFGVFNTEQRIQQTINTIDSIKARVPNAWIYLVEMAGIPLQPAQQELIQPHVKSVIDFSKDPVVQEIYKNENWDIVKNFTEMYCFRYALAALQKMESTKDIDRIFKMSGRYLLNDNFKISKYLQPGLDRKIVVAMTRKSQFPKEVTGGLDRQYMSRCWSFDATLIAEIELVYGQMLAFMDQRLRAGGYVDIEHCLYKFLPTEKVIEEEVIGVQGLLGPNGTLVKD